MSHPHKTQKYLGLSILLNVVITVAQGVGGLISGSLALLSDALHNFSDVLSLLISFIANRYAKKAASNERTFGYKRAEIIAAFINAASLMILASFLIYESILRFITPEPIQADWVIALAILGIIVNGLSVLLLHASSSENMNLKSAYLHLLSDMSASVAVLLGGVAMYYYQWFWVDSLLTLGIAIYLLIMGYGLLKESFNILMLFTPDSIDLVQLRRAMKIDGRIDNIHHLHVWQVNEYENHLEAHIDFTENISLADFDQILDKIEAVLLEQYGINHVNIQPEYKKDDNKNIIVQD
ncbi:MAG TPA: cation transporter [Flavobacteriaceae bacterium]|nr:cation transporter [Flavobacteriaceae bacterium]